jgi:hypothetical protein
MRPAVLLARMNREEAVEALARLEGARLVYATGPHGNNARARRHYERAKARIEARIAELSQEVA